MLVLARQRHEKIVLPTPRLTSEVVAIKPGVVRLGIEAPRALSVLREELPTCATIPNSGSGEPAPQPYPA
jgi:carbon storage regulator CsrA